MNAVLKKTAVTLKRIRLLLSDYYKKNATLWLVSCAWIEQIKLGNLNLCKMQ